MGFRSFMVVLAILASANHAPADAAPPFFPRDKTNVKIRFENLHEFENFDFYLKTSEFVSVNSGGARSLTRVRLNTPINLFCYSTLPPVFLVAVPSGKEIRNEDLQDPNWQIRMPDYVKIEQLRGSNGFLSQADDGGEITCRVVTVGASVAVEVVEANVPLKIWRWLCIGILTAVGAFVLFGLALIIWRSRKVA